MRAHFWFSFQNFPAWSKTNTYIHPCYNRGTHPLYLAGRYAFALTCRDRDWTSIWMKPLNERQLRRVIMLLLYFSSRKLSQRRHRTEDQNNYRNKYTKKCSTGRCLLPCPIHTLKYNVQIPPAPVISQFAALCVCAVLYTAVFTKACRGYTRHLDSGITYSKYIIMMSIHTMHTYHTKARELDRPLTTQGTQYILQFLLLLLKTNYADCCGACRISAPLLFLHRLTAASGAVLRRVSFHPSLMDGSII